MLHTEAVIKHNIILCHQGIHIMFKKKPAIEMAGNLN